MNPTRALIDAAEAIVKQFDQYRLIPTNTGQIEPLRAAISSAKAAEESPTFAMMKIRDLQMQNRIAALELEFNASCPCGRAEALARIPEVQGMNK